MTKGDGEKTMKNPIIANDIQNYAVILWQYDNAVNLINLITKWNEWSNLYMTDFWDSFLNYILKINETDSEEAKEKFGNNDGYSAFGLNLWGNMMGLPRPRVVLPVDGNLKKSDWTEGTDYAVNDFVLDDGKIYRCTTANTSSIDNKPGTEGGSDFWEYPVSISDGFYKRILKSVFYLTHKKPTVSNYENFLHILFPGKDTEEGKPTNRNDVINHGQLDFVEYPIENPPTTTGNPFGPSKPMAMGFTFPIDATDEEAMMIVQHYDTLYRFPAAIRTHGEYIQTDMVIGLNNSQTDGQKYRNFANGFALAKDQEANGGILSTTDKANYKVSPVVSGYAFVVNVVDINQETILTFNISFKETIWIDWGDGDANYHNISAAFNTKSHQYSQAGLYCVSVFTNNAALGVTVSPNETKKYTVKMGE